MKDELPDLMAKFWSGRRVRHLLSRKARSLPQAEGTGTRVMHALVSILRMADSMKARTPSPAVSRMMSALQRAIPKMISAASWG